VHIAILVFVEIREETRAGLAGIAFVGTLAFGRNDRNDEAELVDRPQADGAVRCAASFGLNGLGLERPC
jgi:hypothetical protein